MAVQFGNCGTSLRTSSASSLSGSMTINAGQNLVAVARVGWNNADGLSVSSVTYGGQTMTAVGAAVMNPDPFAYVQLFYLVNPPTGSNTLAVTMSDTCSDIYADIAGFVNVDQTTPVRAGSLTTDTVSDGSSHLTLVIPCEAGDLTVSASNGNGGGLVGTDQTQDNLDNNGGNSFGSDHGSSAASGASYTHVWTTTGSTQGSSAAGFALAHDNGYCTRYVDADATAGGDGLSVGTVSGDDIVDDGNGHRPYDSLNAWEAARQGTLTEIEECICCSQTSAHTADTTPAAIAGWTTTSAYYPYVHGASALSARWDTSRYRLESTATGNALATSASYTVFEDLQVKTAPTSKYVNGYGIVLDTEGQTGYVVRRCVAWATLDESSGACFVDSGNATFGFTPFIYENCLALCGGGALGGRFGFLTVTNRAGFYRNCTAVNAQENGWETGWVNTHTCTNCLAFHNNRAGGHYDFASAGFVLTYCASEDGSADDGGGDGNLISIADPFVDPDYTNPEDGDWRIRADADVVGAGTDLSGTFTTDLARNYRGTNWDIGASLYLRPPPPRHFRIPHSHVRR